MATCLRTYAKGGFVLAEGFRERRRTWSGSPLLRFRRRIRYGERVRARRRWSKLGATRVTSSQNELRAARFAGSQNKLRAARFAGWDPRGRQSFVGQTDGCGPDDCAPEKVTCDLGLTLFTLSCILAFASRAVFFYGLGGMLLV